MRILAIVGILLALLGVFVAPGLLTQGSRRRSFAIHRLHPDDGDTPWDLTGWIPVGRTDSRGPWTLRQWFWAPNFRRIK
jgi:hypothetical protein